MLKKFFDRMTFWKKSISYLFSRVKVCEKSQNAFRKNFQEISFLKFQARQKIEHMRLTLA